jgi:hypothetical protein
MNKPLTVVLLLSLGWLGCDRKTPSKPVVAGARDAAAESTTDEKEEEKTDATLKATAVAAAGTETDAPIEKPSARAPGVPKDEFPRKMAEWKLTPEEIGTELATTGRVVREKPAAAVKKSKDLPEPVDPGQLATVISIKFGADSHLFATKINVTVDEGGVVTLKGSVKSPELIARAIFLALKTDGIGQVVSLLTAEVAG